MVYTLRRAERTRVATLLRALIPACDDDALEVAVDVLRRLDAAALRDALDAPAVTRLSDLGRRTSRPDVIEALLTRRAALDP
jgi:hypothetical protein